MGIETLLSFLKAFTEDRNLENLNRLVAAADASQVLIKVPPTLQFVFFW